MRSLERVDPWHASLQVMRPAAAAARAKAGAPGVIAAAPPAIPKQPIWMKPIRTWTLSRIFLLDAREPTRGGA
jgi:hypothetical protein